MFDWIMENKEWLFSGVGVAVPLAIIGWLCSKRSGRKSHCEETEIDNLSVRQTYSVSGDNVGRDKIIKDNFSVRQKHSGSGDNVGRDKIIKG